MTCYRCGSPNLPLARLTPRQRKQYGEVGIVMRVCLDCDTEQNHVGDDEPLSPLVAAQDAPKKEL